MSCDQFQKRFDRLLDQRQDVRQDKSLLRHSKDCSMCRQRLEIWNQIDEFAWSDPASADPIAGSRHQVSPLGWGHAKPATRRQRVLPALATAAAILLFASLNPWRQNTPQPVAIIHPPNDASTAETLPKPQASEKSNEIGIEAAVSNSPGSMASTDQPMWRTTRWWAAMSDDQWVSQTIPAVTSVRQGVAPIGRSMKRALSILMLQSNSSPLSPSSVAPVSGSDQFQEQSSSEQQLQRTSRLS